MKLDVLVNIYNDNTKVLSKHSYLMKNKNFAEEICIGLAGNLNGFC